MSGRSGILLVDKPAGITSHDVVSRTRRLAQTRKVGHAGTLDPMATGLLVLGVNSSTRLLTFVVGLDKEYLATIRLGASTTTDDAEGEVISTASTAGVGDVTAPLAALTGTIQQVPSSVSAIKVDGKRAYSLVREGIEVELRPRTVTVSAIELLDRRDAGDHLDLDVRVECSSGTYIRAIARDLGTALGVGGHLTALRRTRIGPFSVAEASVLDGLDAASALIGPADAASRLFPVWRLTAEEAAALADGKRIRSSEPRPDGGPVAALAPDGRLVGLVEFHDSASRVLANFPKDDE